MYIKVPTEWSAGRRAARVCARDVTPTRSHAGVRAVNTLRYSATAILMRGDVTGLLPLLWE